MFIGLLVANVVIAFIVCFIVARVFRESIARIMARLVSDDVSTAWTKYLTFAIYVVGISGGVQIWALERYLEPGPGGRGDAIALTRDRMALDVYRTIIETLQADAWMLLVFFIFALIAYVILRGFEFRKTKA